jgi:hypothetical protein
LGQNLEPKDRDSGALAVVKVALLLLALGWGLAASVAIAPAVLAQDGAVIQASAGGHAPSSTRPDFGATLERLLWIFLILSLVALVLLIFTVLFLIWGAKRLVKNAVRPDLPALERLVARKRARHPDLAAKALAKKLIHRQSVRAGLVGFATGVGGLPTLPFAIPIDLALTVKLQSNLVHMLRIATGGKVGAEEVSETSLWLITTGGQELAAASGTMIRELVVKLLSKSLLKFVPLVGGLVGFVLNWASTQTLGRLTLAWIEGQAGAAAPKVAPAA